MSVATAVTAAELRSVLAAAGVSDRVPARLGIHVVGDVGSVALAALLRAALPSTRLVAYTYIKDGALAPRLRDRLRTDLRQLGITHREVYGIPDNRACRLSRRPKLDHVPFAYSKGCVSPNVNHSLYTESQRPTTLQIPGHSSRELRISAITAASEDDMITHFVAGDAMEDRLSRALYRMKRNSTIMGLSGIDVMTHSIPSIVEIPRPITILSPLIRFPRARLAATLKEMSLAGYEEVSPLAGNPAPYEQVVNDFLGKMSNPAFRKMLPASLTAESLEKFFDTFGRYSDILNRKSDAVIEQRAVLDPPTGSCFLDVRVPRSAVLSGQNPAKLRQKLLGGPYVSFEVAKKLLRKTYWKVYPPATSTVKLAENFFCKPDEARPSLSTAGALICHPRFKTGLGVYTISREPFKRGCIPYQTLHINERGVYDRRFVISVAAPKLAPGERPLTPFAGIPIEELEFVVKPFSLTDYQEMKRKILTMKSRGLSGRQDIIGILNKFLQALDHYYEHMPPKSRETIPCVAIKLSDGSTYVAYVPCLDISLEPAVAVVTQQSILITPPEEWQFI